MQLSELITNVNYRRREGVESFVSNDELKAYFNEGLRDIYRSCDFETFRNSGTLSYVDGTTTYTISAVAVDFKSPISLFYDDNHQMTIVSPDDFVKLSAGSYDIWAIKNATEFLVHTTFGTGDLTLNYYSNYTAQTSGGSSIQSLSSTTDSPALPYEYQDMLVDYAAARCYQKEGLLDDYQVAYNSYLDKLKGLKGEMGSYRTKPLRRMKHISETVMSPQPFTKSNPLNQ